MTPDTNRDYAPQRKFRAAADEWEPFGDAARSQHPEGRSPRSRVLRDFMRWYMRRPGAKLPERPPAGPWSHADSEEQSQ